MKLVSFNVLSHKASKFIFAGKRSETEEEYTLRYKLICDEIGTYLDKNISIVCLQELTPEFISILITYLTEYQNMYWFKSSTTEKQGIIANIKEYSYRHIPFDSPNRHNKLQTLLIHQHYPERVFYLANIHLSGGITTQDSTERQNLIIAIIKNFQEHNSFPIIIVGDYNDELTELTPEFTNFLKNSHMIIFPNNKITSYHKYDFGKKR